MEKEKIELMHEIDALNHAEYRDQHIKRLMEQIESMKCCGNCGIEYDLEGECDIDSMIRNKYHRFICDNWKRRDK